MTRFTNKPAMLAIGAIAVIAIGWLAFGYFGIQAAFIDNEVNEAGPVFAATTQEQDAVASTDEFQDAMAIAQENVTEAPAEEMPEEITTLFSGNFSGESRYEINGEALVLNDGSEQRFLRFENFDSSNGPDLKVYLRADNGDFVSLGDLKGNIGDQNYEIPVGVDLEEFATVEIWCERFGVGFGSASLT